MSYGRAGDEEQALSSPDERTTSNSSPVATRSSEWAEVTNPAERRKIQNKLAQQRFRAKAREQREEAQREATNRRLAAKAYMPPDAAELEDHHTLSGLPWGGLSLRHVIISGQDKERNSQYSSQENSVYAMRAGGSSR
ncbi:hypothetical protein B5807_01491 [Epicoccum nigrum]|uniref:BZIP domain-containing protein n=1 Tax=Epicoccum nigrum TaxID=105696 RepID=A0A1Y2MDF7_EPING|nr:hypothetical protein B5807_01491 [Epicoccum nigrum]